MTSKHIFTLLLCLYSLINYSQHIIPTPQQQINYLDSTYIFKKKIKITFDSNSFQSANYLSKYLTRHSKVKLTESNFGDIILNSSDTTFKNEAYSLTINQKQIKITAGSDSGVFYGIQSLLQLLPHEILAKKENFKLKNVQLKGIKIIDSPKYSWRGFMLDSGRQYQTPNFIKRYLDFMAMLKMNIFHWHLTEGQGWRIEIKKYPKLTQIGSKVASGKEQQGFYSQEEIRDIISYAKKLHIQVVPEIDIPGHSEAALTAHPEMTCFKEAPESVMTFSSNLFCAGREETYQFLETILDEVCELFPSNYIHLGGDEAPKKNWNNCPDCQQKIESEHLKDAHHLQHYFSKRLANYLNTKNKKVIFWGDIVYHEGDNLPKNVVIQWWNYRKHKNLGLKNAIKQGLQVICNTNNYTYLNFPTSPWSKYKKNRTFDLKTTYEQNPSNIETPHKLILGMSTSLWTDWHVQEHMIDQRVFPRIFSLSEQMWHKGSKLTFNKFYEKVKLTYPLLDLIGIKYGPALTEETPKDYKWH